MPIDLATRRELTKMVSDERHAQIQSIRLIGASAIAAAGQVRDTRLDQLENPPAPPEPDLIFDLMLSLALGPAASAAVGAVLKLSAKGIIASRFGKSLRLSPATTRGFPMSEDFIGDFLQAEEAADQATKNGVNFEKVWIGVGKAAAGEVTSRLEKAAKKPSSHAPPLSPDPAPRSTLGELAAKLITAAADSPASRVEEGVLRSCALQEIAVGKVMDGYLDSLIAPGLTPERADALQVFLTNLANTPRVDDSEARRLRLFFESCIWCMTIPRLGDPRDETVPDLPLDIDNPTSTTEKTNRLAIDEALASYLVRRLPHPLGDGLQPFALVDYRKLRFDQNRMSPRQKAFLGRDWTDKRGAPLNLGSLVPDVAFTALAIYLEDTKHEIETVAGRLRELRPMIYPLDQPQTSKARSNGFRPTQNPSARK